MTVKLIWRTDVHISDQSPSGRKDDWTSTVLRKLAWVGELARAEGAASVLDGGDFFNFKSPSRNSYKLFQDITRVHRAYPCPTYGNVGNHDCLYGDYSRLPQQPLGALFEAGVFQRCYDEHDARFEGPDGTRVRVVGVPYHGTRYDMSRFERASVKSGWEDFLVVMGHCLASEKPTDMFDAEDVITYRDLEPYGADVYCFGHWHKDQGVTTLPSGKVIVNTGSLTRGTLSQDDVRRKPKAVVLTFRKGERPRADPREVPIESISQVFHLDRKEVVEHQEAHREVFTDRLRDLLKGSFARDGGSLTDKVRALPGVSPDVREAVLAYIEGAGGR